MNRSKAFGLEKIQLRNAGQAARLEELALRIREFLNGDIETIEELENRLPWSAESQEYARYFQVSTGSL